MVQTWYGYGMTNAQSLQPATDAERAAHAANTEAHGKLASTFWDGEEFTYTYADGHEAPAPESARHNIQTGDDRPGIRYTNNAAGRAARAAHDPNGPAEIS